MKDKKTIDWKMKIAIEQMKYEVVDLTPNDKGVHVFGLRKQSIPLPIK